MSDGTDGAGPARENLSYEQFGTAVRELAQTIADDGYVPDVVLSIARGSSLVPATRSANASVQ